MVCEVHFNKSLTKERKRNTYTHNFAREWPRKSWQGALTPQGASQSQGAFMASVTTGGWPGVRLSAPGLGWGPAGERWTGGLPEDRGWSGRWDSVGLGRELGALGAVTWRELSGASGVGPPVERKQGWKLRLCPLPTPAVAGATDNGLAGNWSWEGAEQT